MLCNRRLAALVGLVLFSISPISPAASQENARVLEQCAAAPVRDLCMKTCAVGCLDTAFLQDNQDYLIYCYKNGLFTAPLDMLNLADAPSCVALFSEDGGGEAAAIAAAPGSATAQNRVGGEEVQVAAASQSQEDCSTITRLSERILCEDRKSGAPQCSDTVYELNDRATVLVGDARAELESYGELLTRDWTDVSNQQALCELSRNSLDENYEKATQDPERLRVMQDQAGSIQTCASDWEAYVRENPSGSVSDNLINDVTRSAERELAPLRERMEELNVSTRKLESAAETIYNIMRIHVRYCRPDATPT